MAPPESRPYKTKRVTANRNPFEIRRGGVRPALIFRFYQIAMRLTRAASQMRLAAMRVTNRAAAHDFSPARVSAGIRPVVTAAPADR
jgi:hypothetical protein